MRTLQEFDLALLDSPPVGSAHPTDNPLVTLSSNTMSLTFVSCIAMMFINTLAHFDKRKDCPSPAYRRN